MFQFPASPRRTLFIHVRLSGLFPRTGFPIRTPADQRLFAPPRGFSQLVASFIGYWRQGIRPVLLSA